MQITPCPTATTNSAAAPSSASDCDLILCDEIPLSSTADTTGGAVETTGSTNTGSADCKVDPGYYLSSAGAGGASAGTITQVPAGKYFAGGTSVDAMSVDVPSSCPENSNSPAGSDALADCTCDAGYTLSGSSCVVDAAPPTTAPPTSAGATIPVVAAFAAMAMPLLV